MLKTNKPETFQNSKRCTAIIVDGQKWYLAKNSRYLTSLGLIMVIVFTAASDQECDGAKRVFNAFIGSCKKFAAFGLLAV
jgi:hypothetical protein